MNHYAKNRTVAKDKRIRALENQTRRVERILLRQERLANRYSWARLAVFFSAFVIGALAFYFYGPWAGGIVLALFVLLFITILIIHGRIERGITRFRVWLDIKNTHLARARLDWSKLPRAAGQPEHPLELDLDLVGEHSLSRLIDTTASAGGSGRLRTWLAADEYDPRQSLRRQQVVRELTPRPSFRDRLTLRAITASDDDHRWQGEALLEWLKKDGQLASLFPWLAISAILAGINILLFLLDLLFNVPPIWQGSLLIYFSLFLFKSRELDKPFGEASHLRDAMEQLLAVFRELEAYSYSGTPALKEWCSLFLDPAHRPSAELARVNRVVAATGIRGNPLFWLALNLFVPWDFYFAYLMEKRKKEIAHFLPGWMDSWFDIEALSALASFAYLNPHYTFPEIKVEQDGHGPVFQAADLGHPLLPDADKITNEFTVGSLGAIDLFTGSNMSGKSTFLRTVGINLVLSLAGGPVDASHLQTIPFRLFTCIRISDSVTDGISYFYAEVKCLKALIEALEKEHPLPLFYFIDEIFRGTNNRERLQGSRAYIKALVGKPGVGLVATHDLELVQLSDEIPTINNYHFTDEIVDGRMFFDYKLRLGPSPTTNALKIMRLEGLPVP